MLWRATTSSVVLLPLSQAEPFLLSGTGVALWDALAAPLTDAEATEALARLNAVDAEAIAADVAAAIAELERRGAVSEVAGE